MNPYLAIIRARIFEWGVCSAFLLHIGYSQVSENAGSRLFFDDAAEYGFFEWEAAYGRIYFVQYSYNLKDWFYFPRIVLGDDHQPVHSFEASGGQRFLRLVHADAPSGSENPELSDLDGDAVANLDELSTGSDPFINLDTNNNQVPDDWESFYGVTDLSEDLDGDGMTAYQEYLAGEDPTDYFNGVLPSMEEVAGPSDSLSMRVTSNAGSPLEAAPVLFEAVIGEHLLALTPTGAGLSERVVRTDSEGIATVYFVAPE